MKFTLRRCPYGERELVVGGTLTAVGSVRYSHKRRAYEGRSYLSSGYVNSDTQRECRNRLEAVIANDMIQFGLEWQRTWGPTKEEAL